ncbi:MAG: nicotinate phosphoribosyltransferase [Candidatus Brocadia sp.]|jgi:nicotinate phosphoribosyltransferase|nr:Nicotinate phosphoribosyltransferase pncB2 [Candidatus Brocadia fulgida]MCC6326796.1 nicotinate phosphoribosyltransferase [Candidatus Brocadia sp.]MCE7912377.1 nicotinate phosphoribosyltransferase [Candidatus Brocadia sp. AMX3]OQZ00729.1 MAG: nicotinate phosphoribosyltransferase [Candidatus Brocadia sp. UTAMX2]MDG5995809.1 nicotinate phosphoribosyltransferase [Candidatus Brocadia sp.]
MNGPKSLFLPEDSLGILTDLYQLTMAAGYFEQKMQGVATFELFVRHLPKNRSYLVAAGLEQALHYLTHIKFSAGTIGFLRQLPVFHQVSDDFFEYLRNFTFHGAVYAMPEGTIAFAEEPLVRVTAPIIETQIIETYLLATINFQTSIATKASRVVTAAQGREVIDFGTRRAHGMQAGVLAARASFIGGCKGTSNVFAACELGIPAVGTLAHSWILAFENEQDAFGKFYETFPDHTILLIDTYDTVAGARHAATIGRKLKGVRLDSGNLSELSRQVRRILDAEGLSDARIIASGDLNEDRIDDLLQQGAPIDSFGVGTEMVTSKDAPALGGVYKLVEQEQNGEIIPKMKFSEDKLTYPCKKQVYRIHDENDCFVKDIIGLEGEDVEGIPLLLPVITEGKISCHLPSIHEIQRTASDGLARLPEPYRRLKDAQPYPVMKSSGLEAKRSAVEERLRDRNIP